jgi:hypothetical protein
MKRLRLFLVLLLSISLVTTPSFAAVKAGAKCTKAGATSTSGGKKYTCIKSGGKLVWNKGVAVKAAAKPELNPVLKPVEPTPSPSPTVKVEEPVRRWQDTQFAIVKTLSALTPATVQKLNFVYSPNVNKSEADKLQASYQEPISLLSNLYVNPRPVTFLVMSETERDWWWSQASLLATKMPDDWWGGSHCQPSPMAHCGYGSMVEPDGTFHFGQLLGSRFVWQFNDYAISYHESIHVYQLGLMGNRMTALPFWFAEGQANYFGYAFSHKFYSSEVQRRNTLRDLRSKFPSLAGFNQSQWVEWLNKVDQDSQFTFNNGLGYSIGELILESLYNEYNYQKVHDWMVTIKNGDNYKDAFKKVFGKDYGVWMETVAAPYLDSQI